MNLFEKKVLLVSEIARSPPCNNNNYCCDAIHVGIEYVNVFNIKGCSIWTNFLLLEFQNCIIIK